MRADPCRVLVLVIIAAIWAELLLAGGAALALGALVTALLWSASVLVAAVLVRRE